VAIDDSRLDPIWAKAGELGIPVAIHSSDPDAFFLPIDRFNERYEELQEHPDWVFTDRSSRKKRRCCASGTTSSNAIPGRPSWRYTSRIIPKIWRR
jgi:hypothetical protein